MPFVPVEFTGLTVTPYVNQAGRLAYSLKATGVTAARGARGSSRGAGPSGAERGLMPGGTAGSLHLPAVPGPFPLLGMSQEEVIIVCAAVRGEQYAQVDNPDPFAPPVWRSPVHRTPEWIIWLVQFVRLLARVVWFIVRHPLLDVAAGLLVLAWLPGGLAGRRRRRRPVRLGCWSCCGSCGRTGSPGW